MTVCIICGKQFTAVHSGQTVCSAQCLLHHWEALPAKQHTKSHARRLAKTIGLRSMGEARFAAHLDKVKVHYDYEPEYFEWVPAPRRYTPDFRIKKRRRGSGYMYIEYKGKFSGPDRTKIIKVKESNPDLDLRLIFERANNKLSKASSTTYAQWAEKHGIPWAEGEMPGDWRKE